MRLLRLATALVVVVLAHSSHALHAEDAGKVDWHTKLIGIPLRDRPFVPNFHRVPPYRFKQSWKSVILTATDANVVAGLNPADSSVVWRRQFTPEDPIVNMKSNSDVIALYGRGEPKSETDPFDPRGPVVLATLSGSGGATLRVFEATNGALTFETELHKPADGILTQPATLSNDIVFAIDNETPDIIALANGRSVTRVNGFTGAKVWSWQSEEAADSVIYTKLAIHHNAVYVLGLVKSFRSYTLRVTALEVTKGTVFATQDFHSDIVEANDAFVSILARSAAFPTIIWVDNGQAMSLALNEALDNKPVKVNDGKFERVLDVGLEHSGLLVGIREDGSAHALSYEDKSSTVIVKHAFPVSKRSTLYTDAIYLGTLDKQGRPYIGRTFWMHSNQVGGTHVMALSNGQIHGVTFPFDTNTNGLIVGAAIDVAQPEPNMVVSRTFTTSSTGALQLWQNQKLVWGRDEALADLGAVEFVDLPEKKAVTERTGNEGLFERIFRHVVQLQNLPVYMVGWTQRFLATSYELNAPAPGELWRDPFGFRKVIIAASNAGKVYALDSTTGVVLWSKLLGTDDRNGYAKPVKIFVMKTAAEAADPEVLVVAQHHLDGQPTETLGYHFNALTGFQWIQEETTALGGSMIFAKALKDAFLITTTPRVVVLVDSDHHVHIYPQHELANTILAKIGHKFRFALPADTLANRNMLVGHAISMDDPYPLPAVEVWRTRMPPGEEILSIIHRPQESTPPSALGRVLQDKRTLYRYLNPSMFAIVSASRAGPYGAPEGENGLQKSCAISVIDGKKGTILYRAVLPTRPGTCDVKVAFAQNWLVYHYYDSVEDAKGYRYVTVELYEGTGPDDKTSSFDASAYTPNGLSLHAIENSFVATTRAVALATTTTKYGISSRNLIVATAKNQIVSVSRRLLDPRRKLGKPSAADQEEGLVPYEPLLPEDPRMVISHNYQVLGVQHVITSPAQLESTSLVFAYGLDLFGTRVSPSGTFDVLSEAFNKVQLALTVCGLLVAIIIIKPIARNKLLKQKWYG
ncbi:hypothetical protein BKA62DRAFT_682862 [Auriculariales sp. MPI-PUGE-AT-0066]|nr:hypothetical protein BKA62DRAFT_682862 [Auriculariales sp. MPI-PUGE-AT-0066]